MDSTSVRSISDEGVDAAAVEAEERNGIFMPIGFRTRDLILGGLGSFALGGLIDEAGICVNLPIPFFVRVCARTMVLAVRSKSSLSIPAPGRPCVSSGDIYSSPGRS